MSIPHLGQNMSLDFQNSKVKVDDKQAVISAVSGIFATMKFPSTTPIENTLEVGYLLNYFFIQGTFQVAAFPKENMVHISGQIYNTNKESSNNTITELEAVVCDVFGWEQNTGNAIISLGGDNYHLLNKYYHSETLYRNFKLIHQEKTKFQDLRIYDTKEMGRVLSLDYMIQNSDSLEEDSYTIDLCSLVIKKEQKYNHILLVGAGDMIIPDYILRNFNVDKITLVEIDDRVIENTKKYFKFYERIDEFIKNGRLEVIVDDGAKYLRENSSKGAQFDGVIIDNSDVYLFEGPAANLFTAEFYGNILKTLKQGAFFSQQVSDEQVKDKWTQIVKSVGFNTLNFKYSITPEYSTALPLGSAMRD